MRLEAVLLQRQEIGGVCGGDEADLDELAATTDNDAGELGVDVGPGGSTVEPGPLLLGHEEAVLGLVESLFNALRTIDRVDDGFTGRPGEEGHGGALGEVRGGH